MNKIDIELNGVVKDGVPYSVADLQGMGAWGKRMLHEISLKRDLSRRRKTEANLPRKMRTI